MKKYLVLGFVVASTLTACQKDNSQEAKKIKELEAKVAQQQAEITQQKQQDLANKEAELAAKEADLKAKEQAVAKQAEQAKKAAVQAGNKPKAEAYNKRFEVVTEKAYFFSKPHSSSRKKSYMVYGDYGQTEQRSNGYVYVKYVNSKGQVSKGWIDENDLTYY